ncbi:MAG: 50S ribosomal protein L1 [Candidatus Neomarinimicrobiota bacterium]
MIKSKNKSAASAKYDKYHEYPIQEAIGLVKELKYAKFDESVDLAINLGVDPRHADQNIRVTTSLPHGTGKKIRVLVITRGPQEEAAKAAGADYVGNTEFIEKFKAGWSDVDKVIATPDMMPELGRLGKILGPKGLMPNPKSGTVTNDVASAVREVKAGRIELRVDKTGIIHALCGKVSFDDEALIANIKAVYNTVIKARPSAVKGQYLKRITISSSMGPGIRIDHTTMR